MATYLHAPKGLVRNTRYRVDTASGSATPAAVTVPESGAAIGGSYVTSDLLGRVPAFYATAATLYLKEMTRDGVTASGTVVATTGVLRADQASQGSSGAGASAGVPDQLLAGLSATYVPLSTGLVRRTRSVWAVGDSHTAGVGTAGGGLGFDALIYPDAVRPTLYYQGGTWVPWAMLASGCKWTFKGAAATGGYTAAQILATHVPQIIAAASPGDTVVVHAGTNGNVVADVIAIHDALRAAGLHTVAVLPPPNTASSLALVLGMNEGIRAYATGKGIPVADVHAAVADPTTGLWLSAYNNDGTHANQLGTQVIGGVIATVLNGLFTTAVSLINHNAAVAGQLQTKPLALGSPVSGTDYSTLAGIGTGTIAAGAVAGMTGGNGYIFTFGDAYINARFGNWTLVAGRRYRLGMALSAVGSTGWGLRLESNTTGAKILWGLGYSTTMSVSQSLGRFYTDFTVPTGLPDYGYRLRVALGSGVLNVGELTMLDLTAIGA